MSNYNKLVTIVVAMLFTAIGSNAQVLNPVKWTFEANHINGVLYELQFRADMEKDWTVYSQHTSDDGPVPTYIEFEELGGATLDGASVEEGHRKEGHDKLFDTNVIKFLDDQPFIIKQKIKVPDSSKPISGYLTFMTCDKTKCLPPKDIDFSFQLDDIMVSSGGATSGGESESAEKIERVKTTKSEATIEQAPSKKKESVKKEIQKSAITTQKTEEKPVSKIAVATNEGAKKSKLEKPVTWKFGIEDLSNGEYNLIYTAEVDDDWTVYSQFTSDDGPVPTYIEYEEKDGTSLIGEAVEKGHRKEGPDPLFDNVNVIKFLGDEDFVITQKVRSEGNVIKGYLTYMSCDATHCLPPQDVEFEFDPPSLYAGARRIEGSNLGPNLSGDELDQAIPAIISSYKNPEADCGTQVQDATGSYWKIFFGGFAGGLLAILLPCIFPMIPITVSFFTKDTARKGWVNGLIYGLSIVAIFVGIGLAVTAILGPTALNELSTNWIANVVFFLVFIAFAISFFGYFEITLPSSWSTKSDAMADKGGLIGIFFMAATLAIVSFSCTGPIIGTALVQVADSALGPFFIMLGFSIALAIPFGLFAAFPAWLNSLPRSGSWMTSVKVVLGFLELALALKFLSVADMTMGWGLLKYELFMGLWVLIFAGMTAYLFGFIKFPHDSPITKLGPTRKVFAALSLIWTIYIAAGFMYDADNKSYTIPKLISGITPPSSYNIFLEKPELDKTIKQRYPSYTKCANDINCFKDYYDGIAYANEVNKPVLLDFTGYGCVNCRKTEDYIWKDPKIKSKLNDDYVLVSLYVDDRKKLEKTLISKASGSKMRNVGNKWADFQIVNFQQNSQPLYVPLSTDQKVITAPRGYEEGVDNYAQFLDCGLEAFNKG